jgi:hypothetical protein
LYCDVQSLLGERIQERYEGVKEKKSGRDQNFNNKKKGSFSGPRKERVPSHLQRLGVSKVVERFTQGQMGKVSTHMCFSDGKLRRYEWFATG